MPAPVVVLGRFPPPYDGQSVATQRVAELLEDGYRVERLSLSAPEQDVAVDVRFRARRALHYLGALPRIRASLRRSPGSSVIWTSISPEPLGHLRDLVSVAPAFLRDQRVFAVVHRGNFHELFTRRLTRPTGQALIRRLSGVVFNTGALAAKCADWIPEEKRFIIPNTVSGELLCSDAAVEQKRIAHVDAPLRVLYLSNMIPSKGYPELLEAAALLRHEHIEVEIRFGGRWMSDHQQQQFWHRVRELGLEPEITHLGPLSDPTQIRDLYLWADLFALPTYYAAEAHPVTIVEALNAGTPVVSTHHASIPEMIQHGVDGSLVPPRDHQALARAIASYANAERWQAASRAARERFNEVFSPGVVKSQWSDLITAAEPTYHR